MPTENKQAYPKPTGLSQGWNLTRKHDGFVIGHQSAAYPPDAKAIERAERDGYVWVPFLVSAAKPQGDGVNWKAVADEQMAIIQKLKAAQPEPDPMLCKFYDVTDWPGLVRELVGHVAQLQDSAKRNVKPWEDTFPPTLLPAYIERVNATNEAIQALAYRLLGEGDVVKVGDEVLNDDTATWGAIPLGIFIGMPYNRRVMLPVRRAKSR